MIDFSVMGKNIFTRSRKHRLSLIDGIAGFYQSKFFIFFKDLGSLEISMKFEPKEGCLVIAVQRGIGLPEHQIKGPPGKLKRLEYYLCTPENQVKGSPGELKRLKYYLCTDS